MSKQQRLGKGLGAIFPEFKSDILELTEQDSAEQGMLEIPLAQIESNPHQPRRDFSEEKLEELAETIKSYGVIQPVLVQKEKGKYVLVAGERRFRAAQLAGLKKIPAIIKEYNHKEAIEIALVENLQREDLNPIEEANAYKRLLDEFAMTQEDLAKKIGRSRSAIANSLRLLTLDREIKNYLVEGILSPGQARPLLSLDSQEQQRTFALKIINDRLTARQVEDMVKNIKRENKPEQPSAGKFNKEKEIHSLFLKDLEEKIRRAYGTKVNIKSGSKGGKIELYFFGDEDLERLVEIMLKEVES